MRYPLSLIPRGDRPVRHRPDGRNPVSPPGREDIGPRPGLDDGKGLIQIDLQDPVAADRLRRLGLRQQRLGGRS